MATSPLGADSAHVIHPNRFPPAAAGRIAASLLNRHSAHEIAEAVTVLIDVLDMIGGDPDLEITDAEDDFATRHARPWDGPGCKIADAAEDDDDDAEHDGREIDEGITCAHYGIDQTVPVSPGHPGIC